MTKKVLNTKTAGQISTDLLEAEPKSYDLRGIKEASLSDYEKKVRNCINDGASKHKGDFFVVVETKRERLMPNFIRNFIFHRVSCPTPHYGQTVYQYDKKIDDVRFLWCIPDRQECMDMYFHPLEVPEFKRDTLKSVLDFYDDTFLKLAKKLNKEDIILKDIYD